MTRYRVYDRLDTGSSQWIEADTPDEAINEWLEPGYDSAYDTSRGPVWLDVVVEDEDGDVVGQRDIIVPQDPPECSENEHDWCSPYAVVGGLRENPGVFGGPNGGVTITEVCRHCGAYRRTETRHQDTCSGRTWPDDYVSYREPDDVSLEWIEAAD